MNEEMRRLQTMTNHFSHSATASSSSGVKALVVEKLGEPGKIRHFDVFPPINSPSLPINQPSLKLRVLYSSLNYKDGLAVSGKGRGIIKSFPTIPGIDLVGSVEESNSEKYKKGDFVVLTGWGLGEKFNGGFAQKVEVLENWVVSLPRPLSPIQSMGFGTAGLTAMLCVMELEKAGLKPNQGPVVVSGAAGGVGSISVAILANLGYHVTAATGRKEEQGQYLLNLGAKEVINRDTLLYDAKKPLQSEKWAGAIDTVGGTILAGIISSVKYGGSIAACGLAGGSDLPASVLPFILRGVKLLGVDSVYCPIEIRKQAWERLAKSDFPHAKFEEVIQLVSLEEVPDLAVKILAGQVKGRVVVDLTK